MNFGFKIGIMSENEIRSAMKTYYRTYFIYCLRITCLVIPGHQFCYQYTDVVKQHDLYSLVQK